MAEMKQLLIGTSILCGIAVAMLLWALFGSPPYAFFLALKWLVAGSCWSAAYCLSQLSKLYIPLVVLLTLAGGIELLGKMQRNQWVPVNWATIGLLLIGVAILVIALVRPTATLDAGSKE